MRARDTVIWLVVALLFVDLTFFSGASNFLASPQSRILNQVLVLGVVIAGGIAALRGRLDVRSPLLLPGAAWVAVTAIATVTSQRQAASLEALALLLISAPAYFVVRAVLADERLRPRVDWLIILATSVFIVAYLIQALTQWISWWSVAGPSIPPLRPGDVGLTVGTVNAVALYLELLAPIAIWLAWVRWHSRGFTLGLAALAAFALLVTGSRGAWLGAAAGTAVALLLVWRSSGLSVGAVLSTTSRRVVAIGAVVLGVVLLPLVVERMLSGDAGRLELWSAGWSMFTSSPLVGVGPGAWPGLRASTPISDDNLAVLATTHNSILQVLTDAGLIGALAAAWLIATIARIAWKALRVDRPATDRRLAIVATASLVAAGVHSIVDAQFHLPAVVLLVLHLVARLELAAGLPEGASASRRPTAVTAVAGAFVLIGAALLVPIDTGMVYAAAGNQALDRGDPSAAARDFDAAVALHDLPAYRLGQALARRSLGDDVGAAASLEAMDAAEPFTFVIAQRAVLAPEPEVFWARAEASGPYDATASVNLAAQRFGSDPAAAGQALADAMVQAPTLVYSERPSALFDEATWVAAQANAIPRIGEADPVTAAAVAILAGRSDDAAAQRSHIPAGPESDALVLLDAAATGTEIDLDTAMSILRAAPDSPGVQFVLWQLGFEIGSQPLLDAVSAVSVPLSFNVPTVPMELVTDGRVDADYSVRLPRWPQASAGRNGPKRPYLSGFITIEPVFRPKP